METKIITALRLSAMLGVFCITKQAVYMNFKLISNISTFTRKCELINSFACMRTCAKYFIAPLLIVLQCIIEPVLAEPVEMVTKLGSSFFMADKLSLEKVNIVGVKNVDGVCDVETRPKLNGSIATTNNIIVAPSKIRGDTEKGNTAKKEFSAQLFIILCIVMIPIFSTYQTKVSDKPNVELTGRGPESRKTKQHYNRAPVERNVRPDVRICRQKRWAEKRCPPTWLLEIG